MDAATSVAIHAGTCHQGPHNAPLTSVPPSTPPAAAATTSQRKASGFDPLTTSYCWSRRTERKCSLERTRLKSPSQPSRSRAIGHPFRPKANESSSTLECSQTSQTVREKRVPSRTQCVA